jgi:hypothetical protein
MNQPIFFIGPGKSGTSYLYNVVRASGFYLGLIKESNYYLTDAEGACRQYEREYGHHRIIDFSNTYFYNPQIASRLKKDFPDCYIVVVRRDPVDRIASHFRYLLSRGQASLPFEKYIRKDRNLYLSFHYDFFRAQWGEVFQDRLIELNFVDLKDLKRLQSDLNIMKLLVRTDAKVDQYKTPDVSNSVLKGAILSFGGQLLRRRSPRFFNQVKQTGLYKLFIASGSTTVDPKAVNAEVRRYFERIDER